VAAGHPHLAAQGDHGAAVERRLGDLVPAHVMGEPVVVAVVGGLLALLELPVEHSGGPGVIAVRIRAGRVGRGGHGGSLGRRCAASRLAAPPSGRHAVVLEQCPPWMLYPSSWPACPPRCDGQAVRRPGDSASWCSRWWRTSVSTCRGSPRGCRAQGYPGRTSSPMPSCSR